MKQTITIEVPEGKTYKQTTDENGNIIIQYVDREPIRSKSWEEFCRKNKFENYEYYISSNIRCTLWNKGARDALTDKGYLTTREDAEGILALIQLTRLHDEWVGDWKPNWEDDIKYGIYLYGNNAEIKIGIIYTDHIALSFPTEQMAKEFIACFKDLIKKAKRFI